MFRPSSPLAISKSYVATVTTGIKDLAGNFMSSPLTWSFKTTTSSNPAVPSQTPAGSNPPQTNPVGDTFPPNIVSTSPVNGATNVPLLPNITARFSEPLQPSTVSTATFKLKDSANSDIPGTVIFGSVGPNVNTAMFKPSSSLETSKLYTVTITIGVKDLTGNPLAYTKKWSFTTAITIPAPGTTPPPTGQPNFFGAEIFTLKSRLKRN